jgi:hypothetical protein
VVSGERASSRSIARATPSPRGIFPLPPLPYLPHRHPSYPPRSRSSVDCYFVGWGGEWGNAIDGTAHRPFSSFALPPPLPPPSLAARARLTIARRFLHDRRRKLIVALRKGGGRGARTGHRRAPSFVISSPHPPPSPCHLPPLSSPHMLPSLTSPLPFVSGSPL